MGSGPPGLLLLLVFTSFIQTWHCARGQSWYIIDNVGLTILPGNTVWTGTPVTVRCQVSVSHNNIPHLTHTFQLRRDDVPVHSSTTTEDSVEYQLDHARAADSGSYECRVTVKDKSRISFSQKLDVTGLQTPILQLNNESPYENEEFTATCSAPEEKGTLIFQFCQRFGTGNSKKLKYLRTTGNSTETTLTLRHIGESVLFCDYEISLPSGTRRSNSSEEIRVIVKALNISPVMNVLPSREVYEGEKVTVVCKVVGSPQKNIEVFLTKDRRILKQVAATDLTHTFTAVEGDSGELVCKAEWGNVQKEAYHSLTVKELFSKPDLIVEPDDIFEGDRITMSCPVSIYVPDKIETSTLITYYKDGVKLNSSETYVAEAQPRHNGNYTCRAQASSSGHTFIKESPKIVVKAKVPVSKPVLSVVGGTLLLGKPFQLRCHSDSGTLPIMYTLHGPNRLILHREAKRPEDEATFHLSAIFQRKDLENFLCHAKNSPRKPPEIVSGQQLLRSTIIIEPVSGPQLMIHPGAGDISEGQNVTLVCSVQRGSPPINFTWYHKEKKGYLHSLSSKGLQGAYSIHNVQGDDRGEYYCLSTNQAKETRRSPTVLIGVKLAGWKKGLIVVFCLLFVIALILVVAFRKRLIQFKSKTTGKLSVKSASTKAERLSLTQAEVNEAANVTPGMMGKSIWSEHVSGSESDDQISAVAPEKPEPQYTEVQTTQADPNRVAPIKQGTDTVYSEVRNSQQGVPELADGVSVEYAQLNHDGDHQGDHSTSSDQPVSNNHTDEVDNSVPTDAPTEPAE